MRILRSSTSLLVGMLFCLSSSISYAAVTGCAGASITTISTTGGETPAGGCGQTDLGFNTFAVNRETGIGTGNGPSEGTTDLSTSGGVISGGTSITPIDLDFTPTGTGYTTGNAHGASAVDETVSYLATPNLGGAAEEPTGAAGHVWAINGITALTIPAPTLAGTGIPTGTGTGTGDVYLKIIETICLGQTSLANCAAANEATLTALVTYSGTGTTLNAVQNSASCGSVTATFGCVANNTNGSLTFNDIFSAVVTNEIILNHPVDTGNGATTYDLSLAGLDDTFDQMEAPEPSTFILLGSALAGLGALRLRKSRQS
jgi:hypothetical protein